MTNNNTSPVALDHKGLPLGFPRVLVWISTEAQPT
jgi:hypothetical protein